MCSSSEGVGRRSVGAMSSAWAIEYTCASWTFCFAPSMFATVTRDTPTKPASDRCVRERDLLALASFCPKIAFTESENEVISYMKFTL
jgi:hypothetical protein